MNVFKFSKSLSRKHLLIFLVAICIYSTIVLLISASRYDWDRSLSFLADQFLKAHISLAPGDDMPLGDIAPFQGRFYIYFGPFPSIFLMPAALLFGKNTPQVLIGIFSIIVSFWTTYSISKKFKFTKIDSLLLSVFITFSTVVFSSSVINISAYQVEVLGFAMIMLSLREYFSKKRPLIIGTFLGLAILTRLNLVLGILFFAFEFYKKRIDKKSFFMLLMPVILSCISFGVYNFVRFDSIFDSGYTHSISLTTYPISENLKSGYISLKHIPTNIYSFLVKPPDPLLESQHGFVLKFPYLKANAWGTAIWYTSPLFLLFILKFRKNKYFTSSLFTALALALPIFTYFSIGFAQFGYRYALDFLPFLFLLLIPCLEGKLSKLSLVLITIGVLYNCLFIASLWEIYPVLWIY